MGAPSDGAAQHRRRDTPSPLCAGQAVVAQVASNGPHAAGEPDARSLASRSHLRLLRQDRAVPTRLRLRIDGRVRRPKLHGGRRRHSRSADVVLESRRRGMFGRLQGGAGERSRVEVGRIRQPVEVLPSPASLDPWEHTANLLRSMRLAPESSVPASLHGARCAVDHPMPPVRRSARGTPLRVNAQGAARTAPTVQERRPHPSIPRASHDARPCTRLRRVPLRRAPRASRDARPPRRLPPRLHRWRPRASRDARPPHRFTARASSDARRVQRSGRRASRAARCVLCSGPRAAPGARPLHLFPPHASRDACPRQRFLHASHAPTRRASPDARPPCPDRAAAIGSMPRGQAEPQSPKDAPPRHRGRHPEASRPHTEAQSNDMVLASVAARSLLSCPSGGGARVRLSEVRRPVARRCSRGGRALPVLRDGSTRGTRTDREGRRGARARGLRGARRARAPAGRIRDAAAAARSIATFDGMHRAGGVMLLVFAVACLASAIDLAVYGVTPSLMQYVGGLDAGSAPNVIVFLVVMAALDGGIAVRMLAKPKRR